MQSLLAKMKLRPLFFFLDHGEDTGPNIVHSKALRIDREYTDSLLAGDDIGAVEEYASSLQERLKYDGDGPAIRKAIELTALGKLGLDDRTVYLEGEPLPYKGFQL